MKKDSTHRKEVGFLGEELACRFLSRKNFSVRERNYLKKWGEIDIVAIKNSMVHFIEVKTISRSYYQQGKQGKSEENFIPEENIHSWKLKRLVRTVDSYLKEHHKNETDEIDWQMDAIIIFLDRDTKKARLRFIENIGS